MICNRLCDLGAEVRAVDPHVRDVDFPASARRAELTPEELAASDLVIVATDHDAFDWALVADCSPLVFDARHRLARAPHVEHL